MIKSCVAIGSFLKSHFKSIVTGIISAVCAGIIIWIILPTKQLIVREYADRLEVIHTYNFTSRDTLQGELEGKLKTLELINQYNTEIEKHIRRIETDDSNTIPSVLISKSEYSFKGWKIGRATGYFSLRSSSSEDSPFIDFYLDFINNVFISRIELFRVLLYRIEEDSKRIIQDDYFFAVNNYNPALLRLSNDLATGNYIFEVGMILKEDIGKDYPTFYRTSFTYNKKQN